MGLEERSVESDNAQFQASLDAGVETKSDTITLNRHVTGEGGSYLSVELSNVHVRSAIL